MPIVGQFGSLAGLGSMILPGGVMESIGTITVGSGGAASIEFTSIPGTYQHLQVRFTFATSGTTQATRMRLNGVTSSDYTIHNLYGSGSSAAADTGGQSLPAAFGLVHYHANSSSIGSCVIDLLDYASTSKNKVFRSFWGADYNGSGFVGIYSGMLMSTSAVTSLSLFPASGTFNQHGVAALYGIKAP